MKVSWTNKCLLVIDYQAYWREISTDALRSVGFQVCTLDTYNYVTSQDCLRGKEPDLVILGCTQVGPEEQRLIAQVLADKQHLLVLCAYLPWQVMRNLFLLGVVDIEDKPYDAARFIKIVKDALTSLIPRNSYQAIERGNIA